MKSYRGRPAAARRRAAPATPPPAAAPQLGRRLDELEAAIRTLAIDQQRFLAGDLKVPPEDQTEKARKLLRSLRGKVKDVADSFRLNGLEARLNSQLELFERRLRQQERGAAPRLRGARTAPRLDPAAGVVISPQPAPAAENALYKGLYLRGGGKPKVDLERFRAQLRRSAEAIRSKTGCRDIVFRVAVEDGKRKLKARPVRASS